MCASKTTSSIEIGDRAHIARAHIYLYAYCSSNPTQSNQLTQSIFYRIFYPFDLPVCFAH